MKIERLPEPIPSGDWHDKPLRWTVSGPGDEVQHFRTKKDARTYLRIRKNVATFREAARLFTFS